MSDSHYEPMTKAEVAEAQSAWVACVTGQDVEALLELYDCDNTEAPLFFKPTLANEIRHDREGAHAYFVGGNDKFPRDSGFLHKGWKTVTFESPLGPMPVAGGPGYKDMGHCTFVDGNGGVANADYTFIYHKRDGRVRITLHHSSLAWEPPADDQ